MLRKRTLTVLILCILTGATYLQSCSKGGDGTATGGTNTGGTTGGGGGTTSSCSGTPGPKFLDVKAIIESRCISCHNTGLANGGVSYSDPCNIVLLKNRIKVRAVDEGTMPQGGPMLSAAEKAKITDWINAGGLITN